VVDPRPPNPHLASPVELKERIEAERGGSPFVVYRDETGGQRIIRLVDEIHQLTIGRGDGCDLALDWDVRVSGLHAELCRAGGHWLVVDDGLSRNGTFVNGERVVGRRRLGDGDQLELGETQVIFRRPAARRPATTRLAGRGPSAPEVSVAQRRVLVALCRPFRSGEAFARPATNQEIAEELCLSIAAVKTHLRLLFQRFGLEGLPPNEKRTRLVQRALDSGAVSPSELERA
jgi:pSer/pThr/pTyr-binding forkhead associated (FHA) protein